MTVPTVHALGAELTIRNAAEARALMSPLAAAGGPVALDAGALERIDTAGLQLLCALAQGLVAGGGGFSWQARSPALDTAATALGLQGALRLGDAR